MVARSPRVRVISAARALSSARSGRRVPGMGTMCSRRVSSQARASWETVVPPGGGEIAEPGYSVEVPLEVAGLPAGAVVAHVGRVVLPGGPGGARDETAAKR
jgi:hypothetical protein